MSFREWYDTNREYKLAVNKAWRDRNPEYGRTYQVARKSRADELILAAKASGCVDCGEKAPVVLDLDHVRGKKVLGVSRMRLYSLARVAAEIAKCEVRCANCHRRITDRRRT